MPLVFRQLLIWTGICGLCAAPSFVYAILGDYSQDEQIVAMLAGIACFVAAYTAISCTGWAQRFKRKAFVLTTLKIGYGTRMVISLLSLPVFPVSMPDLFVGMWSISFVTDWLLIPDGKIQMVFLTTLVTGVIWNLLLFVFMLLIYATQRILRKPPRLDGICLNCGYDLRASRDRCPECGTAISGTQSLALASTRLSAHG